MRNLSQTDFATLIRLFEETRKGDDAARTALKAWYDARVDAMLDGREARRQLGTLAYLLSEKHATRKLGPGGRFEDLPNDPDSVASRHWERFQPFCEEIERGGGKTVDEFIIRVNALTEYVLLDMTRERNLRRRRERAIDDEAEVVDLFEEEESGVDSRESTEENRAMLRRIFQALPPRLFLVVVLHRLCQMKKTEIAEILGTTAYYVTGDLADASELLDGLDDSPAPDA